jgi:hypothetical protein
MASPSAGHLSFGVLRSAEKKVEFFNRSNEYQIEGAANFTFLHLTLSKTDEK